jgi:hypothetical protein
MKEMGGEMPPEVPQFSEIPTSNVPQGGNEHTEAKQWWEWRLNVDPAALGNMQDQLEDKASHVAALLREADIPQQEVCAPATVATEGITQVALWVCHLEHHTAMPYGSNTSYTYIKGLGFTDTGALYLLSRRPAMALKGTRATMYELIVPPPALQLEGRWTAHEPFPYTSHEALTRAVIDMSNATHWNHIRSYAEEKIGRLPRLP